MPDPTGQTISAPGFYPDLDEAAYHADPCPEPSLSSSLIKTIITKSLLHAWCEHPRLNPDHQPQEEGRFDLGSATHEQLLGVGPAMQIVHAADWRKKGAKEARDEARAAGLLPILADDARRITAMIDAFWGQIQLAPPEIMAAMQKGAGHAEASIVWQRGRVWCRARPDKIALVGDRLIHIDYKTTQASAHPSAVARRIFDLGQDIQQVFHRAGLGMVDVWDRAPIESFIITQETEPPFALSIATIDATAFAVAEQKIEVAARLFAQALATDQWPGYPIDVVAEAELPPFKEDAWIEQRDVLRRRVPEGLTIISAG